jgi:hypothetical protein
MSATTHRKLLNALVALTLLGFAAPMRPDTIVVTTTAELEAALTPANAGKRIVVRAGEYDLTQRLTVPDGATLVGEGEMNFDESGLPTGFAPTGRTLLRSTLALVGDMLTLGDGATMRRLAIEDALGRQGNMVVVSSRDTGDFVSALLAECEIINPNPSAIVPAGSVGRALVAITRNLNLGADPPPQEGAVVSVEMRRSIIRSPGAGIGVFAINFASHAEISLLLQRNVIGGGVNLSGGVSLPDAVTGASVSIKSRRNLYRSDSVVPTATGWSLIGGTTAPVPGLVSQASTFNTLQMDSRDDTIDGFSTGILAMGGLRTGPLPEPSSSNRVDMDVHHMRVQTTTADLVLFGARSFVDGVSPGDGNAVSLLLKKSSGSGLRANVYTHSAMGLGVDNRLELVGTERAFVRTNDGFDPIPPAEFFTESAQTLRVWGDDSSSQISAAPDGDIKAVADGGSINGLALRWDGTPILWGSGPIGPPPIPDGLAAEKFDAVAMGRDDCVLIRPDGTLAAFGRNAPVTSVPAGSYRAVTVASFHGVAIADDGTLRAWGSDSPPNSSLTGLLNAPEGGPFKEVDARVLYSLALHEDGTLYGWGHGANGTNVLAGWTPTPEDPAIFYIPGQAFKAIAAGNVHALAILRNGTVTGWGNGTGGALQPPAHVRFKAVAAGWGFSIGLSTEGTLWGWGTPFKSPFAAQGWTFASQGWTRYGDSEHYYIPDERFKSIAAAAFHVMAITAGR